MDLLVYLENIERVLGRDNNLKFLSNAGAAGMSGKLIKEATHRFDFSKRIWHELLWYVN
jgi:hypothetical protein